MDEKRKVYTSNIQILYSDLKKAVNNYVNYGHTTGDVRYINAYLMAVLGAIVAYKDTVLKGQEESTMIEGCKYANNLLKHDPEIITHLDAVGGVDFPVAFPLEISPIEVVWKFQGLDAKYPAQKEAFEQYYAGREILHTLEIVLNQLNIDV